MTWLVLIIIVMAVAWLIRSQNSGSNVSEASVQKFVADKEQDHIRDAKAFVEQSKRKLDEEKSLRDVWSAKYAHIKVEKIDAMSGEEFEYFLSGLFRQQGYEVEHTPVSRDYGADLILQRDGERIAVQAKRYKNSVGVDAIQEVVAAKAFYHCQHAWVVTSATFTPNANMLAHKNIVILIDRIKLGSMMK